MCQLSSKNWCFSFHTDLGSLADCVWRSASVCRQTLTYGTLQRLDWVCQVYFFYLLSTNGRWPQYTVLHYDSCVIPGVCPQINTTRFAFATSLDRSFLKYFSSLWLFFPLAVAVYCSSHCNPKNKSVLVVLMHLSHVSLKLFFFVVMPTLIWCVYCCKGWIIK